MHLLLATAAPLGLAPAAALAPATAAPQTSVELRLAVDGGDPTLTAALRRRLGDRLLEDGYRLVPEGSAADVRVRVEWREDGATIEADGAARRSGRIARADLEVALLEVQHLASALVDDVRPTRPGGRAALAVDGTGAPLDPGLRERLQAELLSGGVAITRAPGPDDRRVCVDEGAARTTFALGPGDRACDSAGPPIVVDGGDVASRREHLAAAVLAALAAPAGSTAGSDETPDPTEAPPAGSSDPEPRRPEAVTPPPEPAIAPKDRRLSAAIVAHGGLAARNDAPDPLVRAELRVGRRRGLGGSIDVGLIPSRAPGLRILDVVPTAALDWRLGFRERGVVALGAFAGVHVHTWRGEGDDAGRRVGPSVGVAAGFGAIGRRGPLFFGGVRAGWSGRGWTHTTGGAALWRRGPLLVALTLGVGWDLGGRRAR
ncbi:MAG: hypothetical protein R3B09_27685 [Nannocystaceae bacterium]